MDLRNFKLDEFKCNCGCGKNEMQPQFLAMLDIARDIAGVPFVVTSGYRCEEHNKAVGGKFLSSHPRGWAADLSCPDNMTRWFMSWGLALAGFRRFGIGPTWLHVDCDPEKPKRRIWTYTGG